MDTGAEGGIRVLTEEKLQLFGKSVYFCNYVHIWLGQQTHEMDMKNYYQAVLLRTSSSLCQWHLTSEEQISISYLKTNLSIHGVVN